MIFTGYYEETIDKRWRIRVPRKYISRGAFASGAVFVRGSPGQASLYVYDYPYWKALTSKFGTGAGSVLWAAPETTCAHEIATPDASGRLTIPRPVRDLLAASSEVVISGVRDHVEISSKAWFDARMEKALNQFAEFQLQARLRLQDETCDEHWHRIRDGFPGDLIEVELADDAQIEALRLQVLDKYATIRPDLESGHSKLEDLNPRDFEIFVAGLLRDLGYEVELTKQTRDGGYDVLAIARVPLASDLRVIVECKRLTPPHHVGIAVIRSLLGVMQTLPFQPDRAIIATTSHLTQPASDAVIENICLSKIDHDDLMGQLGFRQNEKGLWLPGNQGQ